MIIDFLLGCLIIAAIICGLRKLIARNRTRSISTETRENGQRNNSESIDLNITTNNWNQCYEPTYFMTQNEKAQFRKLMNWAHENHYYVFAKVRLADLIKPRNNNQKLFWKIQAKHIDFLICDGNLKQKLIIELQDGSHKAEKRKERDSFVREVLESCGYKSLWVFNIEKEVLNKALGIENNQGAEFGSEK